MCPLEGGRDFFALSTGVGFNHRELSWSLLTWPSISVLSSLKDWEISTPCVKLKERSLRSGGDEKARGASLLFITIPRQMERFRVILATTELPREENE